ncbi:hypothetical protein [Oricola sp.]|uniref:hypothetical protein n=1 Tax=Oricola sp. TaxID=1979950 RepID=UPI0025D1E3B6|nr:hypothetical protein [Oricola sp.]MCI5078695.1 hypothetical protein [Oricola sp.]
MANTIQFKRRVSGNAGAPAALKSGEVAHNEVDDTLYIGKGDDGSGNATSIVPVAGKGGFADLSTAQTVAGKKTFSSVPASSQDASAGSDLVRKAQLDSAIAGVAISTLGDIGDVTITDMVSGEVVAWNGAAWINRTLAEAGIAAASHAHAISDVTNLQTSLDARAPLASPALTGTPTAPTAPGGANTTQIATTAFVASAVAALVDAAPGTLDTLNELAAALGDDPNFATTITASIAGKLAIASNLSDLDDAAAARTNLGLGSMALQAAGNVAITGGAIDNIAFDCGTF